MNNGAEIPLIIGGLVLVGALTGLITRKLGWPFWKGFLVGVVLCIICPPGGPGGLWLFCFFIQKREPNDLR